MTTRLYSVPVQRRRDWLLVRHRTRQIASLLGYSPDEQAALAAAAFELCRRARATASRCRILFDLTADRFLVQPETAAEIPAREPLLHLERALPPHRPDLGCQDLPFIIKQLTDRTPLDVATEVERQNLELLRLTVELKPAPPQGKAEINAA